MIVLRFMLEIRALRNRPGKYRPAMAAEATPRKGRRLVLKRR